MSGSGREKIVQEVVKKYGNGAEAPAREVAQIYEDEIRKIESQYKNLEQAAINQDRRAANNMKFLILSYSLMGFGLGIIAATFATRDFFISAFVLYIFGSIMLGIGGLLSLFIN